MKLDLEQAVNTLVNFVKYETDKIGLKNAVIGLSGGIDSALSAAIAVKAIGAERVYGLGLPYKLSSKESMEDAMLVADALKINFEIKDITPFADPLIDSEPGIDKLRIGNILARMRMVAIFDRSAKLGAVVLGTSNKTELLLGYCTWYGDLASAINPIGDLYKTQVWAMSEYLNIPEKVIKKAPTGDLWEGQTDEKELGFSYKDVDKLLYEMVDKKRDKHELIDMGFELDFVEKVEERIKKFQFKRKLPIIGSVGNAFLA